MTTQKTTKLKKDKAQKISEDENGFITMLVVMLLLLGTVIYFAYQNVANR